MKKFFGNQIVLIFMAFMLAFLMATDFCAAKTLMSVESQISRIENSLWGFDYSSQTNENRLERLEQNVFGSTNEKESLDVRLENLNKALGFETAQEASKSAAELAENEVEGVDYPQIDALEQKFFKQVYKKENIYKRLERLEKKIFGAKQDGDLASRTDKLKGYLKVDTTPTNTPYAYMQRENSYNDYDPMTGSYGSDTYIQLSGLEQSLFGKTYSQDPAGLRINRLERKIFQRDFSSDDDNTRLQRLQAAASAKKTAKYYDMNKAQKFTSTGLQLGTLVLMILALIL